MSTYDVHDGMHLVLADTDAVADAWQIEVIEGLGHAAEVAGGVLGRTQVNKKGVLRRQGG